LKLRGNQVVDGALKILGTQPRLKVLDLSDTPLTSLEGLPPQPNLQVLIADSTGISSFRGLSRHHHLREVSFDSSPISWDQDFRLKCLILVGQRLAKINGQAVTISERKIAKDYPLIAKQLIEADWELEHPVPSKERFRALAIEKKIKFEGANSHFTNVESAKYFEPPPALVRGVGVTSTELGDSALYDSDIYIDRSGSIDSGSELAVQISEALKDIGLWVRPEEDQIIAAVSGLCDIVKALDQGQGDVQAEPGELEQQGSVEPEKDKEEVAPVEPVRKEGEVPNTNE
jgi:hypothetical protein